MGSTGIGVTITFVFCLFSMSLFRAESIAQARQLWRHLKVTGDGVLYKPMTDAFNDLVEVKLLCKIGLDGIVRPILQSNFTSTKS